MKNYISILMVGLLLISCSLSERYSQSSPTVSPTISTQPPSTATLTSFQPIPYIVTTDLTKRTCPSVSCASIGYYRERETILVDGWLYDRSLDECQSWAHIANETYWVCADYIQTDTYTVGDVYVIPEYDAKDYIVCVESAPVYGMPAGTVVLYYLEAGEIVHIREMSQGTLGWAMIEDSRWILLEYLCVAKK